MCDIIKAGDYMKIVHFSDLHLKKFYKGKLPIEITNKLIEDVWKNLYETCKFINEISADIVLIAGDVFEREFFNMSDMNRFLDIIKSLNARVFISCGNHDYYDEKSLWNRVELPENLHVFSNDFTYVDLDDLGARVFGISYDSFSFNKDLKTVDLSFDYKNFLVVHSDMEDERYLPLDKDFLKKFDYVALGHIHKREKIMDNVYYSGSIEPHTFKDIGDRGIIIFDTDTKSFEFKDFSTKNFVTFDYEVKPDSSLSELLEDLQNTVNDRDLYRIRLIGKHKNHNLLKEFLENNLNAFYFEIVDEVKNDVDVYEVFGENNLVMDYLNSFNEEEENSKEVAIEYLLEQYNEV